MSILFSFFFARNKLQSINKSTDCFETPFVVYFQYNVHGYIIENTVLTSATGHYIILP